MALMLVLFGTVGCNEEVQAPFSLTEVQDLELLNPFESYGKLHFLKLQQIQDNPSNFFHLIDELSDLNMSIGDNSFRIDSNFEEFYTIKIKLSQYLSRLQFDYDALSELEQEILNSHYGDRDFDDLFHLIAILKHTYLFLNDREVVASIGSFTQGDNFRSECISCHENCIDQCMRKKLNDTFDDATWIEWAYFMYNNPGGQILIWYIGCAWKCRGEMKKH